MTNKNLYDRIKISLVFLTSTFLHEVGARTRVPNDILDGNYVLVTPGVTKEIYSDCKEYTKTTVHNDDNQVITDNKYTGDAIGGWKDSSTFGCMQGIRALVNKMKMSTKNTGNQVQHNLMGVNQVDTDIGSKPEVCPKWMLVDDSCQKTITTKKESKEHKKHNSNLVDSLFGCGQGLVSLRGKTGAKLIGLKEREYVVVESITDPGQKVNNLLGCGQGLVSLRGKIGAKLIGLKEREYVVVEGITEDFRTWDVARIVIKFQADCKKHGKIQATLNNIMNPILPSIAEKSGYERQPTKQMGEMSVMDWTNASRRFMQVLSAKGSIAQRLYRHSLNTPT